MTLDSPPPLIIRLVISTLLGHLASSQMCGRPLAYKNKRVDGTLFETLALPSLSQGQNVSNADCMRYCCENTDCNTLTFSGFITSASGKCLLYSCASDCVLVDDNSIDGTLTIALNRPPPPVTESPTNDTSESDSRNATVLTGGPQIVQTLFKSCSTPIGIAIFVSVFCCAINLGLLISLMYRHRLTRGYNTDSASSAIAGTSSTSSAALKRSQHALHAYNNVGLEATDTNGHTVIPQISRNSAGKFDDVVFEQQNVPVRLNIQFADSHDLSH